MTAMLLATVILVTSGIFAHFDGSLASMSQVKAEASKAITYEYYTVKLKNTVPVSWLFVGTYLMSAKGVTPQVYQLALKSRDTYDQHIAFYTSELDGGQWKNIKDATNLNNITAASGSVTENDLFPYLITCVVGDDGIPRDPESGNPMDVFSTPDPYEMENIPELDGIEEYYRDLLQTDSSSSSESYRRQMLSWFFEYDNLDTYDRETLDVAEAYQQYQTVSSDPKKLEDLWDDAMKLSPSNFPIEYADLMMVMRNFPNVRDKVTDKADSELESLNALFTQLADEKLNEEADAVLYVSAQVDAARRAEIYYNLTQNENITGSFLQNRSDLIEELTLRREELNAQMMEMSASSDRAEAPVKKLRQEINALEDENTELQTLMDEENATYKQEDPEEKLYQLNRELAVLEEEFTSIEEEYNRLNTALDEIVDESTDLDDSQSDLKNEIKDLRKQKKTNKEEAEAKLAKLAEEIQEKTDRYTKAELREEEYYEGIAQIEKWESNIARLEAAIRAETTNHDALKSEADVYTSSRLTASVDAGKIYDPEKKTDLDHQVAVSQKIIDTLTANLESVTQAKEALEPELEQLQEDLALGDSLEGLQQSYNDLKEALYSQLALDDASIDASIREKQEEIASLSEPFQESLRKLEEANNAYNEYLPTYETKLNEVSTKHEEVIACEKYIEQHETMISSMKEQIAVNKAQIRAKDAMILPLMPAWDCLEAQIAVLQDEVDELDVLIIKASTVTVEDEIRREAYGNTRNSIEKRLELINVALTEAQQAQLEIIKANSALLAEKKSYAAEALTFMGAYDDDVAAINKEEDEWDEKWQSAASKAEYDLYAYMNGAEPDGIQKKITEEKNTIATYEAIISKMAPYLKNEETIKQRAGYLEQKNTISTAISDDVSLLATLDPDDESADEIRERITANKTQLAEMNQSLVSADGLNIESNQVAARGALTESEINLTEIASLEGVDDKAQKELDAALRELDTERQKLTQTKRIYDMLIGYSNLTYQGWIDQMNKKISDLENEIEEVKHQYDGWPKWIRNAFHLDERAEEEAEMLSRQKNSMVRRLQDVERFPEYCEKNGLTDYVPGSDFTVYAKKKYAELLEKENELYANSLNGTPVQNYVEKVQGIKKSHEEELANWQIKLAAWETAHEGEIAALKQAITAAQNKLDREGQIRQERLLQAKQVYQTRVSDNQKKTAKIDETLAANNAVLKEFQEEIEAEFGARADELLAKIPGLSTYVADAANRRTLAELKTYLEERLSGVDIDVSAMEEQKSENEHLQRVYEKQQQRLTSIMDEWTKKAAENTTAKNASYSAAREVWLNKQKESKKQEEVVAALTETAASIELEINQESTVKDTHTKDRENLNKVKQVYDRLAQYKNGYETTQRDLELAQSELEGLNSQISDVRKTLKEKYKEDTAKLLEKLQNDRNETEKKIAGLEKNSDYVNYIEVLTEFDEALSQYGFLDYDITQGNFDSYMAQKEAAWAAELDAAKAAEDAAKAQLQTQLDSVLDSIRQNERILNDLFAEEDEADQNMIYAWTDITYSQEILNHGYQIRVEAQQNVIDEAKKALDEGEKRLQELKDAIDDYYGEPVAELAIQLAEADALYRSLDYVDAVHISSFGPSPTLNTLRDAAESGNPDMGRKFSNMKNYRGFLKLYSDDETLTNTIDSAYEACETSYASYTKQAMSRGETAADYTGFLMSRKVARNATNKDAAMPYLQMIVDLTNIEGGSVVHSAREISLLEGYLVPFAMSDFTTDKTEERMDDYHYYIRAITERDTIENSMIFVENRLEYAYSLETTFANEGKTELIQAHITWLENLLRALKELAGEGLDDDDTDSREAELIQDREEALEEGDLKRAKKIDDLLSKIKNGGGSGDDSNAGKNNNPDDLGPTDIDPNSRPKPEQEIMDLILEEIENPEYDINQDLPKFINVGGPMEELEKELEKVKNPANKDAILNPAPTGGEVGGGKTPSGSGTDISSIDIDDGINDGLGHGIEDATDEEIAAAVEALSEIADTNPDDDLTKAINDLLNQLLSDGSSYVYEQYRADKSTEYVSMAAVDNCRRTSGFRYVKENDTELTTMTQVFGGSASYTFTNGSKSVLKNNGEKDSLSIAATRQTDKYVRGGEDTEYTYLCKEDAKKFMYVSGRYIKGTDMAILITSGMEPKIRKIVEALEEKMMLSDE